ncbi:hypothetical protein [Nonomuraea sp. NPDC003804]|uniref:hypothetical protein n=1 Tax=Nonomuraea sp. NPDC003804 TaxID=3154547 RepID=UPI00339F4544
MTERIHVGNAAADALGDRGWLLGHFKPEGEVRHSEHVEVDHSWVAEEESVVMTVRWPSVSGYAVT